MMMTCNTCMTTLSVNMRCGENKYGMWMVCGSNAPPDEGPTSSTTANSMHSEEVSNQHFQKQFVLTLKQFVHSGYREMSTPGWVKEARIPDSDEKTCLTTVYAAHVPSGFLCLDDKKRETTSSYSKKQHCRGAVGTSTRAGACASRQASHSPFSSFTPPVLSTARSKISKATASPHRSWRSSRQQHSAPGSAAQKLRGSGSPGAPATFNSFWEEDKCDKKTSVPVLRGRRGCKQPAAFMGWTTRPSSAVGATVLRRLRGSQSEPLPALLFLQHVDVLQVIPHPYDLAAA